MGKGVVFTRCLADPWSDHREKLPMSTHLDDMAYRAQQQPAARFTALAHHLTEEFLEETWQRLNAHGALGLSGETMAAYARVRRFRIAKLVERLKA